MGDCNDIRLLETLFEEKGGKLTAEQKSKLKKRKYYDDDIKDELDEVCDERECTVCQGSGDNFEFVCPECGGEDYMDGGCDMICLGCGKDWDDQMECKHCQGTGIKMDAPP